VSKVTGYQYHPPILRITHWLNALAMFVMIGSGLRIYNWYPALSLDFIFPFTISLGGDPVQAQALHAEDGLASALMWHFAGMWLLVANLLVYLGYGFFSGHFRRDFLPVSPRAFLRDFVDAARGRLAHRLGEYNAVQKVFYIGVLAAIAVTVLSGLGIWKPVQFQVLTALFGGYETARVVHFFGMASIVAFVAVHLALTALVPQTLKAMITGQAGRKEVQP
jgi:thiosulfate reductase cytochrome b subunit